MPKNRGGWQWAMEHLSRGFYLLVMLDSKPKEIIKLRDDGRVYWKTHKKMRGFQTMWRSAIKFSPGSFKMLYSHYEFILCDTEGKIL